MVNNRKGAIMRKFKLFYALPIFLLPGCELTQPPVEDNNSPITIMEAEQDFLEKMGMPSGVLFSHLDFAQQPVAESMMYLLKQKGFKDPSPHMGLSTLLDVTKQLNGAATLNLRHFPQQQNSRRKILILESNSAHNYPYIADINQQSGFVELATTPSQIAGQINTNSQRSGAESTDTIAGVAMKSEKNVDHDASVAMYASSGLTDKYLGYLEYPNSALAFFNATNSDNETLINNHQDLLQTISDAIQSDYSIISMSFQPSTNSLKHIAELSLEFGLTQGYSRSLTGYTNRLNNSAQLNQLNQLIGQENLDFIWLISLDNEELPKDTETRKELLTKLFRLQTTIPNIYFVSSTHYDHEKSMGTRNRSAYLDAKLRVYTILAPPVEFEADKKTASLTEGYDIELKKNTLEATNYSEFSTSFATPIASTVIHNIWSLVPSISRLEIFDILEKTSRKQDFDQNIYGVVIDPSKAYQYVLGKIISSVYTKKLYPNFKLIETEVDNIDGLWKLSTHLDAKESTTAAYDIKVKPERIFISKSYGKNIVVRPIKTGIFQPHQERKDISFSIDKVTYLKNAIEVIITKNFVSKSYSDTTIKKITINFQDGETIMAEERPIKTQNIKSKADNNVI